MIHEKVSINPIFPNYANITSLPRMQQVEKKSKGGVTAIIWLGFARPFCQTVVLAL